MRSGVSNSPFEGANSRGTEEFEEGRLKFDGGHTPRHEVDQGNGECLDGRGTLFERSSDVPHDRVLLGEEIGVGIDSREAGVSYAFQGLLEPISKDHGEDLERGSNSSRR